MAHESQSGSRRSQAASPNPFVSHAFLGHETVAVSSDPSRKQLDFTEMQSRQSSKQETTEHRRQPAKKEVLPRTSASKNQNSGTDDDSSSEDESLELEQLKFFTRKAEEAHLDKNQKRAQKLLQLAISTVEQNPKIIRAAEDDFGFRLLVVCVWIKQENCVKVWDVFQKLGEDKQLYGAIEYCRAFVLMKLKDFASAKELCKKAIKMQRKNGASTYVKEETLQLMLSIVAAMGDPFEVEFYETLVISKGLKPVVVGGAKKQLKPMVTEQAKLKKREVLRPHNLHLHDDGITILGSDEDISAAINIVVSKEDIVLANALFDDRQILSRFQPIFDTIYYARIEIFKLLISKGADVNGIPVVRSNAFKEGIWASNFGAPALHIAAEYEGNEDIREMVKMLLENGADPLKVWEGKTYLEWKRR